MNLQAVFILWLCFLAGAGFVWADGLYPPHPDRLTRQECMRCHPIIAKLLRINGAGHKRVACRSCHRKFHVYKPGKTDYQDILPKCSRCHGHPHGKELTDCSSCHTEAHTPLDIPATLYLAEGCRVCHQKLYKEVMTFTTKHSEFHCTVCHHTRHGYIPECLECHQPHQGVVPVKAGFKPVATSLDGCKACHQAHKALNVRYSNERSPEDCALCHRKAYEMLKKSRTKHSALSCTRCHPDKHKTIKRCRQCHGQPHPSVMFKKFGSCGRCHGVAHSIVK